MTAPEHLNSPNNELKDIETGKSEALGLFQKIPIPWLIRSKLQKQGQKMSKDPNYLANKLEDTKTGKASKDPNFPANQLRDT